MTATALLAIGDAEKWMDLATAEALGELRDWNSFTYARWEGMTELQQSRATSKAKWKFAVLRCGNAPQYSFDPAAPDYGSLGVEGDDD